MDKGCKVQTRSSRKRRTAGPVRDRAIPPSGDPQTRNRLSDILDLDHDTTARSSTATRDDLPAQEEKPGRSVGPGEESENQIDSEDEEGLLDDIAEGSVREQDIKRRERALRKTTKDEAEQAGDNAKEDWRTFDTKKAIQSLESDNPETRKKAIQRLHIRWFHATTIELERILRASGAPARAIGDIPAVVKNCLICREWTKPGPRNVMSVRLITDFNIEVQMDTFFYHSLLEPKRGGIEGIVVLNLI